MLQQPFTAGEGCNKYQPLIILTAGVSTAGAQYESILCIEKDDLRIQRKFIFQYKYMHISILLFGKFGNDFQQKYTPMPTSAANIKQCLWSTNPM